MRSAYTQDGPRRPVHGATRASTALLGGDRVHIILHPASTEDALRYVLANVDDARAALETANSAALATATAYGRIAVARNNEHEDETE